MKSYTDLEQSKKLTEILPVESADMWWNFYSVTTDNTTPQIIHLDTPWVGNFNWDNKSDNIPCWSLAALLEHLRKLDLFPEIINSGDYILMDINFYYDEHFLRVEGKTILDACYEMILRLHEQKLL